MRNILKLATNGSYFNDHQKKDDQLRLKNSDYLDKVLTTDHYHQNDNSKQLTL